MTLNNTLLSAGANNSSTAFSGTMSSLPGSPTSGFVKVGNGTMTLSGNNTYAGPTTVKSGTLLLGSGGGASGGSVAIANSGANLFTPTNNGGNPTTGTTNISIGSTADLLVVEIAYDTGGPSQGANAPSGNPSVTYNGQA